VLQRKEGTFVRMGEKGRQISDRVVAFCLRMNDAKVWRDRGALIEYGWESHDGTGYLRKVQRCGCTWTGRRKVLTFSQSQGRGIDADGVNLSFVEWGDGLKVGGYCF